MVYSSKVYRSQGASAQVIASGGTLSLEAGAALNFGANVGVSGFPYSVPLGAHLFGARELSSAESITSGSTAPTYFFGGLLLTDTTPALTLTSSGDQSFYLNWASANVDAIKLPPIAMPEGLSTAGGLMIELKGEVVGTASAADAAQCFDIRCWSGIGDTEMGATHPNFTSAPTWKGIRLSSADLTTGSLNITLVPQTHAARPIRVYDMRARFNKTA